MKITAIALTLSVVIMSISFVVSFSKLDTAENIKQTHSQFMEE